MKNSVLVSFVLIVTSTGYAQFDSLNVRFVGNWPFGPSYAVAHDSLRNLVFLGSGGGVYILDASDPENPVKLSEGIHTRGVVNGLFYDTTSQALYIAAGKAGLEIWNVSTPTSPVKLGGYYAPSFTQDVFVSGLYAYITGDHKLRVIDVSAPSAPQEVGQCDLPKLDFENVYVSGSYAYVRCGDREREFGYLSVIDISTPSCPQEVGSWTEFFQYIGGVYVSGSYAYLTVGPYLCVLDISIPSNPQEIGYCLVSDLSCWVGGEVYVSGSYAYLNIGMRPIPTKGALCVVDVSDPTAPQKVGWYETDFPDFPNDLSVSGSHVYVACSVWVLWWNAGSFSIIDVSTPSNPQRTGYYETLDWAYDIYVSNSYACLADRRRGIKVIDVSTPSNPQVVGSCNPLVSAQGIYVSGSYAYVSDFSGFQVIDVSKPSDPHEVGRCDTLWYANDVHVSGFYAYVATGDEWVENKGGLHVLDVSVHSNPREVGYCEIQRPATGIYVSGIHAYVAAGDAGLRVIRVSPHSNPQEVGNWDGYARDVYVSGSHAYVAGNHKLHVIDVSIPSEPQEVGHCDLPEGSELNNVFVSDSYAYVACSDTVRVIDISTPSNPHEVGYYETPASAIAVYTSDHYIYVADGAAGLQIYKLLPIGVEEKPMLDASPIRLETSLNRLSYDVPGQAQLTLYSSDGRKVLTETVEGKGVWDAPAELPHGVYFARIENDSGSTRTKLVVLR